MSDLSRRDAIKAVATAGAVAGIASLASTAQAADDKPAAGWGKDGDQAFKLTEGRGPIKPDGKSALLSDNCEDVKDDIKKRFAVYYFGDCNHPTPVDADVEAAGVCLPQVIANGGVINTEFGHKTVKHKAGPISYNTYLAYAAADRP